ncbi:MAG: GNAT family N-acetyltransferase [Candidatus Tectomicrobia bacterium]|nr:GNAT family N-acetyltransferase [Candidatus Tectomicrobia bacterium]
MSVIIRPMEPKDLVEVSEMYLMTNPFTLNREHVKEWTEKTLNRFPTLCYVAQEGETLLGATSGRIKSRLGIIDDLAVKPEHQHKKLGSALLERALEAYTTLGAKKVRIEVHFKNASSIPFWYKYGFRLSYCEQDHFGPYQDAIFLVKG